MKNESKTQPLDAIMAAHSLSNTDLVAASREQLTHKQVQKARSGRHVTAHIQGKIVRALNARLPDAKLSAKDLFCCEGE